MKYLFLLFLLGCSVENVGQEDGAWKDYCKFEYIPVISKCENIIRFTCLDGANDIVIAPALGSGWIGSVCYQELDKEYFYVCGVNDKNQAWVYCNK